MRVLLLLFCACGTATTENASCLVTPVGLICEDITPAVADEPEPEPEPQRYKIDCEHVICYGHERYTLSPEVSCTWPCTRQRSTGWERTKLTFAELEDGCFELDLLEVIPAPECAAK